MGRKRSFSNTLTSTFMCCLHSPLSTVVCACSTIHLGPRKRFVFKFIRISADGGHKINNKSRPFQSWSLAVNDFNANFPNMAIFLPMFTMSMPVEIRKKNKKNLA